MPRRLEQQVEDVLLRPNGNSPAGSGEFSDRRGVGEEVIAFWNLQQIQRTYTRCKCIMCKCAMCDCTFLVDHASLTQ